MRTILLRLEFDGTDFSGWQIQPERRTVQGVLEQLLSEMLQEPDLKVTGSGRTDAGVHALGMGASFTTRHQIPLHGLVSGMNAQLEDDLVVLSAQEVPSGFCARRWAEGKRYRYQVWNQAQPSALFRKMSVHVPQKLDVAAMREAARVLVGRHNFASFRASGCASKHPVREIWELRISQQGSLVLFEFYGSAFLRYMVRNLVGTLLEVGLGKQPPSWVEEVLNKRDRREAGKTAPPHGLCMVSVDYKLPPAHLKRVRT